MSAAYRQDQTLYVTAQDSWSQLSVDEQRKNLQRLIDYPGKVRYTAFVIFNSSGRPFADISPNGIFVEAGETALSAMVEAQ
jgi:hypothetical protein